MYHYLMKMLVHWNSHFHPTNMENEVYSERSMSMHSLCSIILFRYLIRSVVFSSAAASSFRRSVILQQALIKSRKKSELYQLRSQISGRYKTGKQNQKSP